MNMAIITMLLITIFVNVMGSSIIFSFCISFFASYRTNQGKNNPNIVVRIMNNTALNGPKALIIFTIVEIMFNIFPPFFNFFDCVQRFRSKLMILFFNSLLFICKQKN